MLDKVTDMDTALRLVQPGASVMLGGFGLPGTPVSLIHKLAELGTNGLTVIKNEANEPGMGVSLLLESGQAKKIILSHLGLNTRAIEMLNAGELEVEFYPQGILAEKIRCAGAGLYGFVTDIGKETVLAKDKQRITMDGKELILEPALKADAALIHAAKADTMGNLVYTKTAQNFNPLMAMAADLVIAEAAEVVAPGQLDPDCIHTPAAFVDHVVDLGGLGENYDVLEHHVQH